MGLHNDFAICLFSFDINPQTKYNQYSKSLIQDLINNGFKNIFLLTNDVTLFKEYDINVFNYSPEKFSFFDKLTICKIALEKFDQIIYLDCDSRIDLTKLKTHKISEGLSFCQYWLDGELKRYHELKNHNTEYFISIAEYCEKNNLEYLNSPLVEERLFTITKTNKTNSFFNLFFGLRDVFENNDIKYKNYPVGRAEGLAIGISLLNSKIEYQEKDVNLINLNLKHLPNEIH